MVTNRHGTELSFAAAMSFMTDDDILDSLAAKFSPCSFQRFFSEYEEAYLKKYGTEWELSAINPIVCW